MADTEVEFESEVERLSWLVATIREREEGAEPITIEDEDHLKVFIVSGALSHTALTYAAGISALLAQGEANAWGPLLRALFEVWNDVRYILREGSPLENARKFEINALLEALDLLDSVDAAEDDDARQRVERRLAQEEAAYPDQFAAVQEQRANWRFHWSGQSRTRVAVAVGGEGADLTYKGLSWDAHAVMTSLRDIEINPNSQTIDFKHLYDTEADREQLAYRTSGMLFYIWNEFAKEFGLPEVESAGA